MASKSSVEIVNSLKDDLIKEFSNYESDDFDPERCIDIIKRLDEVPMTLPVLSKTLVGTAVSKCKSVEKFPDVKTQAKLLVKKWKKLAKESGITSKPTTSPPLNKTAAPKSPAAAPKIVKRPAPSAPPASKTPDLDPIEWKDLLPFRKTICKKFCETLMMSPCDKDDRQQHCITLATAIEGASHQCTLGSRGDKAAYSAKARQLLFNLKKNPALRENILNASISPAKLVKMSSEELCTSERAKAKEEAALKLNDSNRLDWDTANEDKINQMCGIKGDLLKASLFTCGRCKSTKTTSTQKQTRSADEPMTVFVFCINCGNRW
eukprot:CAMPEP_0195527174 /NCGR_PEP_ID=MMETSP0794_2-20130614/28682_1 /TAXON_ID=515487 /ORGANISM="Stephanopyxis turris, Strain CCMP 815" /LENGTH=320 /DNA_ID=CAMNT_0040658029 /DNA_START=138 /DNA_END=1097 /DNA_ORIENTATION=-